MKKFLTNTKLFEKYSLYLFPDSISSKQLQILENNIIKRGGDAHILTSHTFSNIKNIDDNKNRVHILCHPNISANKIQTSLDISKSILEEHKIVSIDWLHDTLKQNTIQPTQDYLISYSNKKRVKDSSENDGAISKQHKTNTGQKIGKWTEECNGSLLVYAASDIKNSNRIAGFDMDGTLIKTKSGKKFAVDINDWVWFDPSVPTRLKQLALDDGYKLMIISNQAGIAKGHSTKEEVQTKVENILEAAGINALVYLSIKDDEYRKPRTKVWDYMINTHNNGIVPNLEESFYVGDAAGRPKEKTHKKDFSASDLKFSLNLKLPFHTPESFFLNSKLKIHNDRSLAVLGFIPMNLPKAGSLKDQEILYEKLQQKILGSKNGEQEIIVLVGSPASGKSTLCTTILQDYIRVNQDTLKTIPKCKKECLEALKSNKSVVIDNTNRAIKTREEWINIAKNEKIPIRCIYLNLPKDMIFHLNTYRNIYPQLNEQKSKVPDMVIHSFYKYIEIPRVGFTLKLQFS